MPRAIWLIALLVLLTGCSSPPTATLLQAACPTCQPAPTCPPAATAAAAKATEAPKGQAAYTLEGVAVDDPAAPGSLYEAEPGKKLVGVEVIISNVSGNEAETNPLYATLVDADGFNYRPDLGSLGKGQIEMVTLKPGDKVRGWIGFKIPDAAKPASIKYDVSFSGPALQAALPK